MINPEQTLNTFVLGKYRNPNAEIRGFSKPMLNPNQRMLPTKDTNMNRNRVPFLSQSMPIIELKGNEVKYHNVSWADTPLTGRE